MPSDRLIEIKPTINTQRPKNEGLSRAEYRIEMSKLNPRLAGMTIPEIEAEIEKQKEGSMPRRSFLRNIGLATAGVIAGSIFGSKKMGDGKREAPKRLDPTPIPEKKSKEEMVKETIEKCTHIIQNEQYDTILENPYLVSALYYSEEAVKELKPPYRSNGEIISSLYPLITKDFRENYINFLKKLIPDNNPNSQNENTPRQSLPLDTINWGDAQFNHPNAIDLFIKEGSTIHSMSNGIVVLAENTWQEGDSTSTTSALGGNTVIIFNPNDELFYRYAHMSATKTQVGTIVSAGEDIGVVGHTGKNASRVGHGGHLHLEIHKYDRTKGIMRPEYVGELKKKLK